MIVDIWQSFRRVPLWVQIWVAFVLVPVNTASVAFLSQSNGLAIACLAIGGMLPNLLIMAKERGLSKAMSWPHVVLWPPLLVLVVVTLQSTDFIPDSYRLFLMLLLAIDAVSLAFDIIDARKWAKGDRTIA